MLKSNAILFLRVFSVSAFIGISYLFILEAAQMVLRYDDGLTHSIVAFAFYFLGIFVNYLMQKKLVFNASNSPWKSFLIYNISSAVLVSAFSGYLYSNMTLAALFHPFNEAASTALALLLISPVTFIVFKKIFKYS